MHLVDNTVQYNARPLDCWYNHTTTWTYLWKRRIKWLQTCMLGWGFEKVNCFSQHKKFRREVRRGIPLRSWKHSVSMSLTTLARSDPKFTCKIPMVAYSLLAKQIYKMSRLWYIVGHIIFEKNIECDLNVAKQ